VFTPQRVGSETEDDQLLEARDDPRSAFRGHQPETAWDDLHVAYFNSRRSSYITGAELFVDGGVAQV
jgi:hypothetical protein